MNTSNRELSKQSENENKTEHNRIYTSQTASDHHAFFILIMLSSFCWVKSDGKLGRLWSIQFKANYLQKWNLDMFRINNYIDIYVFMQLQNFKMHNASNVVIMWSIKANTCLMGVQKTL